MLSMPLRAPAGNKCRTQASGAAVKGRPPGRRAPGCREVDLRLPLWMPGKHY